MHDPVTRCPFCRSSLVERAAALAAGERWCAPCQRVISPLQVLTHAVRRLADWQGFIRWLQAVGRPELAGDLDRYVDGRRGGAGERDPVTLVLDLTTARRVEVAWNAWV